MRPGQHWGLSFGPGSKAMTQTTPGDLLSLRQKLTQAVMDQDMALASSLLSTVPPDGDTGLNQIAARLYMATQKWPAAAAMLVRLDLNDLAIRTQLNLARNLASLQQHRPTVYDTLLNAAQSNQNKTQNGTHSVHRLPDGQLTIARQRENDQPLLLSTGPSPAAAAAQAILALAPALAKGSAIGLSGAGDGHFIAQLAKKISPLPFKQTSAIHLFEPAADLLMQIMLIHDYTGPAGPIEQTRFQWHVGPQWQELYESALINGNQTLPEPATIAQLSTDGQILKALFTRVQQKAQVRHDRVKARIDAYYESFTAEQFKVLCSSNSPRQPRVLLVTSRFTSVLQHETRRIADTFAKLGWQTQIAIEPDDHHRLLTGAMHQFIDAFKPDLFFTLDHLRHEQGSIVPANLPYCCWVQDLLPNITNTQAGQSIGNNDWVITFCTPLLTGRYQYPPARCIDAPIMMASEPSLPESWNNDGPDLAYVSNLSQSTEQMIATTLKAALPGDQPLLRDCANAIVNHYKLGRCLPSKTDIGSIITPIIQPRLANIHTPTRIDVIVLNIIDVLWNPLNIGLYRQQSLGWLAQIASEKNLTLALFGQGWEQHPQFAPYAKGPIHPGEPLQQMVRSAKINLNLEPYPCTTHVRLLDGLTAGGFYLVRAHPANTLLPKLAAFINQHAPDAANDADALAMTPERHLPALRDLLSRTSGVSYDHPADVVAQMRCYQHAQVMHEQDPLIPALEDITFEDFKSCREKIMAMINDAPKRKALRDKQHKAIASRLTLRQGLSRIITFMHDTAGSSTDQLPHMKSKTKRHHQQPVLSIH